MSFREFSKDDIFRNIIEVNPSFEFKIYNGNISLSDTYNGYANYGDLIKPPAVIKVPSSLDFSIQDNSGLISVI